jgi:UPF0271 protein
MNIFVNADLGEGEPAARTRALMQTIDLANISCGGHAGNLASMEFAVETALKNNVKIGAHPGIVDRGTFGRHATGISADALQILLVSQVSTLAAVANRAGAKLNHIKLHGALYHLVESTPLLAAVFLETVGKYFPKLTVIAQTGGEVEKIAPAVGVSVLREAFADRGYDAYGYLITRGEPGAIIESVAAAKKQVIQLATVGILGFGKPDTICVHSDSPQAVRIARAAVAAVA